MRYIPLVEEALQRIFGTLAGLVLVAMMAITVRDVVGRALFDAPLLGVPELTQLGVVASVYLGLAFAESARSHIRVDLIYEMVSSRGRRVMNAVSGLVTIAVVALLTWRLTEYALSYTGQNRVLGGLGIPYHVPIWIAAIGSGVYLLSVIVALVEDLVTDGDQLALGEIDPATGEPVILPHSHQHIDESRS